MVNSEEFAARLQQIMDHYHLNGSAFAESIGVQRSAISHILSGRNKPSLEFVMKILDTYPDVELYWLLNGKGQNPFKAAKPGKQMDQDLFTEPSQPEALTESSSPAIHQEATERFVHSGMTAGKKIRKVVIFYDNGSYEEIINS
ncbi:helix-turn-helix domain-containing protein [Robertkochia flava]|uniref:helix-turn-helix domain-containing protein n=1 Tax=Robertkochia flava TaxID=3447986 RepID=UPI001CCED526|nr:helix-turn-helix transcriptional regulator [Robertkochia marina]